MIRYHLMCFIIVWCNRRCNHWKIEEWRRFTDTSAGEMKTRRNMIMWYKKILNFNLIYFRFNWFPNINDILFQGAEELNRAVKSMKDTNSLLPQLRTFLTFLDSTLEAETNFKVIYLKYIKLDWIFFAIVELFCV